MALGKVIYNNKSFTNEKEYPPLKDFWNIKPTLFDPGVPYPKPKKTMFLI